MKENRPIENRLMTANEVRDTFGGVSDMTLWRWLESEQLGFPKPLYIQRRRFWRASDIEAFVAKQAASGNSAAA